MKALYPSLAIMSALLAAGAWLLNRPSQPTVLSFRIGESFEEVARNSSYPVMERSNLPSNDKMQFGATWVTEPAVVIRFNDPVHGFTLPPTKFAALSYMHNKAATLATSPMLERVSFDQAIVLLEALQNQFKAAGWEPWRGDGSEWFDLTLEGRKRLYEKMFQPGWYKTAELRIPNKYAMTFRLWCASGCRDRVPPYLFLIDIGVADDIHGEVIPTGRPTVEK